MSRRVLWATLALSLLVTLALYAVRLAPLESVLTARGHGIVALELAGTGPRFTAVVQDWGMEGVAAARAQTRWDFLWIPAYATALWAALQLAARSATGRLRRTGVRLATLVPVAAAADVVENVALLTALRGSFVHVLAPLATLAALVKFAILLAGLAVIVGALVRVSARGAGSPRG